MKKLIVSAFAGVLVLSALATSSCSTVKGLGQDIQKGGQALEKNATR